ncbi:MAG: alpha/beta fold hydrolase [Planctomycetaceae bacterium]|nr:alpha/beta fold hydrolase [Planctomycetaceae bacterium]
MKNVTVNGVRHSVYDQGSGPTILFVHGFPLSHAMWEGQLSALAKRYRVVAPDLRGFGASDVVPGKTTMRQLADDCAALLDALKIAEPVVLCGLSMGGYVAWQFAKHHAAKLKALVLCDTKAAPDSAEAAETRLKMAEHVLNHGTGAVAEAMPAKLFAKATFERQPEIVAGIRHTIEATSREGLAAAQRGMAEREDVRGFLPHIAVPTLVVVGREDSISPVDEMRSVAEAIPKAKFHVIETAGHMAPQEQPAEFNQLLNEFISGLQ